MGQEIMDLKALLLFRLFICIAFIMWGIILPIRRNEAQGSMGKKVFWLSVGVVLMLAVSAVLLKDQMYIRPYSGSWGYYFIFISALAVSYFFGYTIVLSDKFIVARSQLYIVFYGIILVGTILSLLFGFKSLGSLYIGMGIYTLILGAAEVGILWHKRKRLSERELNKANLPSRNYVQGSMVKKVFWLSVSVLLTIAVILLQDLATHYYYYYPADYWLYWSAGMISFGFGYTIVMSDEEIIQWGLRNIIFYGIILVGTIVRFLFSSKSLGSLSIGMGIYILVLGAAEVWILWHRKKRLSERELHSADSIV